MLSKSVSSSDSVISSSSIIFWYWILWTILLLLFGFFFNIVVKPYNILQVNSTFKFDVINVVIFCSISFFYIIKIFIYYILTNLSLLWNVFVLLKNTSLNLNINNINPIDNINNIANLLSLKYISRRNIKIFIKI